MKSIDKQLFNFVVVIRSAGERTVKACKHIVTNEISEENVHIIQCVPFEAALKKCYEIGSESEKKWLITIDGDVLPRKGFINELKKLTKKVNNDIIMFNAIVHDKLLMNFRTGGIKVYRTKYLDEALQMIPKVGSELRPEATTLKKMENKGYKKKNFNYVAGLHDYEQYYQDVYRKSFFHATKHKEKIANLLDDWKVASSTDTDYLVAIKGAVDGFLSKEIAKSDVRIFEKMSQNTFTELNVEEKEELKIDPISEKVEKEISNAGAFYKLFELKGVKEELKKKGIINGILWYIGHALEVTGMKFKRLS